MLERFLAAGYRPMPFVPEPPERQALLLRHDIDFDVLLAGEMATAEAEMGVRATYFLMLRSASYNLLDGANAATVEQIREGGHSISLHFDPTLYEDFEAGLRQEREIFRSFFGVAPECVSIHRPAEFFLNHDAPIAGVRHTYQSVYTQRVRYFSDSGGGFRHGHPLESEAFAQRRSIHLLIHPIWWVTDRSEPVAILDEFLAKRVARFRRHMAANCKPYRGAVEGEAGDG